MWSPGVTLGQVLIEQQDQAREGNGEFTMLLFQIATAGKIISNEMRRAGLAGLTGSTGQVNVQGEVVKKLDQLTNSVFVQVMEDSRLVCQVVSEEMEEALNVGGNCAGRQYSVLVDPLDGSSNADINGVTGTIFSVYRRLDPTAEGTSGEDLLRKGSEQVAAGYVMYGPSTILIYTSGEGVNGFTLEPSVGEFILSHQDIRMPTRGTMYAINHGNRAHWFPSTEKLVDHFSQLDDSTHRPYSQRWVGSLTADFHRILLEGGLYLYPGDKRRPCGKLRLLYECAPLAWVAEQAGGKASTGKERILDIQPTELHQRVPLIIGSQEDVAMAERFLQKEIAATET